MKFIAFDLETTGIIPGVDKIVEIGAVLFNGTEVEAVYSTLVNPNIPMPEAASRVNGITDDMLEGKRCIDDLLDSFADFCQDHTLVAHNAAFDTQFLTADIKKFESPAPKGVILDTYPMAKKVFPGLPNYKLGTLVQHLDIPSTAFHRAEEDASYCGKVLIKIIQKISGSSSIMPPLENLIALTGKGKMLFPQIIPQPKQLNFLDALN